MGKEKKNNKEKYIKKRKKNKKIILTILLMTVLTGVFLLYGPIDVFRNWYITTAMTTMNHQYLATLLYSRKTIDEVLDKNKVIEVDAITDTEQIVIMTSNDTQEKQRESEEIKYENEYEKEIHQRDINHPEYKIIEIKEKKFSGYLAIVYDASNIHTLVTSKLNVSGQYVTKMAENNKAILAINGGGFEDEGHSSSGGSPLGLTYAFGKKITDKYYNESGGLIGFDKDNKLILGKMTSKEAESKNIRDAVTCGPFLIINGETSKVVGNGGWGTAPRTAIGQRKDGIVLMLVVDGRRVGMPGADMDDLIKIMKKYDAYNASALDGGTSSVMVENYKVINDPIDSTGKHKTRPIATGFGLIIPTKED